MKPTLDPQERFGRLLVAIIAVLNLFAPFCQIIISFNLSTLVSLIIAAVLSIALFSGVNWVRYLFVLGSSLNVFYYLYLLLVGLEFPDGSYGIMFLFILQIAYSASACLLLLFGKPIKEFLYRQKNG